METKVLSIDVKEAVDRLAKLTRQIELLTAQNADLKKEIKELNAAGQTEIASARAKSAEFEKNHKAISILTAERRVLRREIENSIRQNTEESGSLRALRAELSRLTSIYDSLSKVRREGAEGTALLEKIQTVGKELNLAEQASLRFQRNVGNYQSAFGNLTFQIQQFARELPSLSYGFNVFVGAISNNLPMLIDEVVRARKEYDELIKAGQKATPVWKQIISSVFSWQTALVAGVTVLTLYGREIGDWVKSLFTAKEALSDVYETTEDFHKAVGDGSGGMLADLEKLSVEWEKLGDNMEAKQKFIEDNADAFDKLGASITSMGEAENAFIKNKTAFENSVIARAKAAATMELAAEEYKKAVQKMMEADAMPDTVREFKTTGVDSHGALQGEWVNAKNKNKTAAEAEATALFESGDKLVKNAAEYSAEEAKILEGAGIKAKKANADKVKNAKETADKLRDMKAIELEEIRKAEDEILKTVQDARAREYKEMEFAYDRQIEDLKTRLEKDKGLSVTARQAINDQIEALEKQRANKRVELSNEALQAEIEAKQAEIEKQLEVVEEGTQKEYDIKRQALFDLEALELQALELTEVQKEEIRQKYAKKRVDLEAEIAAEINRRQAEAIKLRFETEMAELESHQSQKLAEVIRLSASEDQVNQAKASAELEMLKLQYSQQLEVLKDFKHQEGETEEEYNARRAEAQRAADETLVQMTEVKVQSEKDAYNSLKDSIEAMGESSTAFAKLSKVLALGEIAINTGKALAAGIAQAQSVPFPANLAAIATTVATILANIATATKTVKAAKFATGGTVTGEGTATSDSIPAMLSNGESVLTAAATSMFAPVLSAFNQIGGGVPIQATETANSVAGEEMLARAFMRGASSLPSPVVSVVDINAGQSRVAQVETLANL